MKLRIKVYAVPTIVDVECKTLTEGRDKACEKAKFKIYKTMLLGEAK